MNKQLTKKTIGIAASAALMASLALSGSAFAAPGNGNGGANGKKGSIEILSICDLNKTSGKLTVWTKIVDTSSESAYGADLDSLFVQGVEKIGTGKNQTTSPITGSKGEATPVFANDLTFDDCRYAAATEGVKMPKSCNAVDVSVSGRDACARSVNADIEVLIDGIHNSKETRYECDGAGEKEDGTCVGETLGGPWSVFTASCSDDLETDANEMASLNVWDKAACNQ